jgi:formate hydrogenlyase subunit 3/multisubunit Na+/H+ antiporter MnhD subunit
VPLHGWLPAAMAAPAPVSALLHAVAVVKAGAFGVIRVIYDVFGAGTVVELGVGVPLAALASLTILWGSIRALQQDEIKKRLAFSTVSQVSYIVLGAALAGPYAMIGGLVHLVHQGLMKITLFFCAGIFDERAGVKRIDGLNGLGARMPWTSTCFSLGAMGMIGLPPLAGFVSKFYLGLGGIEAGAPWVLAVLAASTLLNAAYFLPLLYRLWFLPAGRGCLGPTRRRRRWSAPPWSPRGLAGRGALAASAISPLGWANLIVTCGDTRHERAADRLGLALAVLVWPLLLGLVPVMPAWRGHAPWVLPLAPLPALVFALFGAPGATAVPDLHPRRGARGRAGRRASSGDDRGGLGGRGLARGAHARTQLARRDPRGLLVPDAGGQPGRLPCRRHRYLLRGLRRRLARGLVPRRARPHRKRARRGRVYITLAVAGETLLLAGLLIGAQAADSLQIAAVRAALGQAPLGGLAVALLVAGFGIKAGMVPLHVWLPLAHPVAPVPGSAVLSGAIVKAGLIGMLLFFPLGPTGARC